MRLVTFASGSGGNCALVESGDSRVLIDAGISLRRITAALNRRGLSWKDLSGVLITHEHSDHVSGLRTLLKYHPLPVYAPPTVGRHLCWTDPPLEDHLFPVKKETPFVVEKFQITAFPTSHDTDESVGYRIEAEGILGFCTDTGCVTAAMERYLSGCGAVLLEANHDPEMLRYGPYSVSLKRRILSDRGHMSNELCAGLACELACSGTRAVALGHLSRENTIPELAFRTVRQALDSAGFSEVSLSVAPPDGDMELEVPSCFVSG